MASAKKPTTSPARRRGITAISSAQRRQARWQRERRWHRIIIALGIAVIAAVVALMSLGFYYSQIAPSHRAAVRVNDATLDMGYFATRLRSLAQNTGQPPEQLALSLADGLIDEELVRQGAAKLGLAPTAQEVDEEVRRRVLQSRPEAGGDEAQFEAAFREVLAQAGLSRAQYRDGASLYLMSLNLRDHLWAQVNQARPHVHARGIVVDSQEKAAQVEARLKAGEAFDAVAVQLSIDPTSRESGGDLGWVPQGGLRFQATAQVHPRAILLATQDEAQAARQRLEAGEDFAAIARELSLDSGSREKGGDLGWVPLETWDSQLRSAAAELAPGQVSPPVEAKAGFYLLQVLDTAPGGQVVDDIAFQMEPGEVSPPLLVQGILYYFIQVLERGERPVEEPYLSRFQDQELQRWLEEQRQPENNQIENLLDEERLSWAVRRAQ